jgi:hypothetical protein
VFPVRYEMGFYTPENDILHSRRSDDLKSYTVFLQAPKEGYQACCYNPVSSVKDRV